MTVSIPSQTPDWAAIRHAYEQGEETVEALCQRFGIGKGALEYRCRSQLWLKRRASMAQRRETIAARLLVLLERQAVRLAAAEGETLTDREVRQLGDLIKNLEKMAGMAVDKDKADKAPQKRDMRDLRDKLAKRLEQYKRR